MIRSIDCHSVVEGKYGERIISRQLDYFYVRNLFPRKQGKIDIDSKSLAVYYYTFVTVIKWIFDLQGTINPIMYSFKSHFVQKSFVKLMYFYDRYGLIQY